MSIVGKLRQVGFDLSREGTGTFRGNLYARNFPGITQGTPSGYGGHTWYVDSDVTTTGNGRSWLHAKKTITEALAVAGAHDVILIQKGIYDEGAVLNITQEGLKIFGMGTTRDMWGMSAIKASAANHICITINANEVEIGNMAFIQNNANVTIDVATTVSTYKTHIHTCYFGGSSTQTYGVRGGLSADWGSVDVVVEDCTFYQCVTGVDLYGTRCTIKNNVFLLSAGDTAINVTQSGGNRPELRILDNTIRGCLNTDTGVKFTGTPTEALFTMMGNRTIKCATPVTKSMYTSWYDANYWGKEDWRYHANQHGKEAAMARGADGNIFYVDLNIATTGLDGRSWASAYQTLAECITVCDTDAAANRNWARRNTIYVIGDELHEDITVLSEKTDIVGVGTDLGAYPRMMHSWAIAAGVKGARFFNMGFWNDTADVGVSIPTLSHGTEFHNCHFDSNAVGTHGLRVTTSHNVKIIGCEFTNAAGTKYSTAAIDLVGACHDFELRDSYVEGVIAVAADGTTNSARIDNCVLRATNIIVDDDGNTIVVSGCSLITAANSGNAFADTAMDVNLNLAVGNQLVSADSNGPFPNIIVLA